jgi:hypothetical protein
MRHSAGLQMAMQIQTGHQILRWVSAMLSAGNFQLYIRVNLLCIFLKSLWCQHIAGRNG